MKIVSFEWSADVYYVDFRINIEDIKKKCIISTLHAYMVHIYKFFILFLFVKCWIIMKSI